MDQRMMIKKQQNALERLETLEKTLAQIISAVNTSYSNMNNSLNNTAEVLDAVVSTLGVGVIEQAVVQAREEKAKAVSAMEVSQLEKDIASGNMVKVDKISDKSTIVGVESDKDGSPRVPGRVQLKFVQINPAFQAEMAGKEVGYKMNFANGNVFEVLEIYDTVANPAPVAVNEVVAPTNEVTV